MRLLLIVLVISSLSGCATIPGNSGDRNLTVGTVQRDIKIGMSGAAVAEALGSPNIVSTDDDRNEVWIYDKLSSHSVESVTRGATGTLRLVEVLGPIAVSGRHQRNSSVQKTLTVIIKFDELDKVRDYSYHTSRF